ncbi:MAG: hypothetical protein DU429_02375 [Candidatus Tokpelaia sp.]|nr:MAG: hypothetical protein DU430_05125 [Candidatus Tokpelaia sp.]KAA6207331.1 MAG: hypothetical protein DU429_02375 [Candidatus Tokpelaia sp.]
MRRPYKTFCEQKPDSLPLFLQNKSLFTLCEKYSGKAAGAPFFSALFRHLCFPLPDGCLHYLPEA